jgi:hypothetical protein
LTLISNKCIISVLKCFMSVNVATKVRSKTKVKPSIKFLRLPMDTLTIKILGEIQAENPYFSELDALRYIIGKQIKNSNQNKLLTWLKTNVGSKQFPILSEDEIFAMSKGI